MKKFLFTLYFCLLTVVSYAQPPASDDYYRGIENNNQLNLTTDQKIRIKKINRELNPQFAAIGKDRSLSGYEKGQKKRALAMKKREAIYNILTENQREVWKNSSCENPTSPSSDYTTFDHGLRKSISNKYDRLLDKLEDKYKAEKDEIKNNSRLSKEERKTQEQALKIRYKAEKDKLKKEKNATKELL